MIILDDQLFKTLNSFSSWLNEVENDIGSRKPCPATAAWRLAHKSPRQASFDKLGSVDLCLALPALVIAFESIVGSPTHSWGIVEARY